MKKKKTRKEREGANICWIEHNKKAEKEISKMNNNMMIKKEKEREADGSLLFYPFLFILILRFAVFSTVSFHYIVVLSFFSFTYSFGFHFTLGFISISIFCLPLYIIFFSILFLFKRNLDTRNLHLLCFYTISFYLYKEK